MNVIHHTNKAKDKIHINSHDHFIWYNKAFDKIQQTSFMIKIPRKFGLGKTYLHIIKAICDKPTVNIGFNDERLKAFMLRSGTKQGCLLLLLVNIGLQVLTEQSAKEKKLKASKLERKKGSSLFANNMILYTGNPKDFIEIY